MPDNNAHWPSATSRAQRTSPTLVPHTSARATIICACPSHNNTPPHPTQPNQQQQPNDVFLRNVLRPLLPDLQRLLRRKGKARLLGPHRRLQRHALLAALGQAVPTPFRKRRPPPLPGMGKHAIMTRSPSPNPQDHESEQAAFQALLCASRLLPLAFAFAFPINLIRIAISISTLLLWIRTSLPRMTISLDLLHRAARAPSSLWHQQLSSRIRVSLGNVFIRASSIPYPHTKNRRPIHTSASPARSGYPRALSSGLLRSIRKLFICYNDNAYNIRIVHTVHTSAFEHRGIERPV
ncbi:hypothetical protein CALCODRAFT_504397 [Calocera cornea HHB12733]|uniref:Uncharacterized protein n=1 Tax=Calocera cornea HHB12733 TaxID=1353952 RepID=A0A165CGJ3_9BASI|nr:hypothetical protein CALCODRAFT_504397 [Calocera cornea HHB12733]